MSALISAMTLLLAASAHAHSTGPYGHPHAHTPPSPWAFIEDALALPASSVSISVRGDERIIHSNGIPNHATGAFPNRGNPNTISEQNHTFTVPATPHMADSTTAVNLGKFGVALNGVPFDPGAAEFWQRNPRSGWQYEAMSGAVPLGLDENNAHVQPDGAYHYHGIPKGLVERLQAKSGLTLLGYAGDGYPIYAGAAKASYRVKSGHRPNGPGGNYNGDFVQDYEYVAKLGDLDECNGHIGPLPDGTTGYHYLLTTSLPYIPRCWKGVVSAQFRRQPQAEDIGPGGMGMRGGPPRGRGMGNGPPPPGMMGPPPGDGPPEDEDGPPRRPPPSGGGFPPPR